MNKRARIAKWWRLAMGLLSVLILAGAIVSAVGGNWVRLAVLVAVPVVVFAGELVERRVYGPRDAP